MLNVTCSTMQTELETQTELEGTVASLHLEIDELQSGLSGTTAELERLSGAHSATLQVNILLPSLPPTKTLIW